MSKKVSLVSVLFFVFIVAVVAVGCSNILLKKDSNFSVSFFTPIIDKAASSASRSATGTGWKINGWLELEDGTILQSQQTTAGAEEAISIAFSEVYLQSNLWIKIDCVSATDKTIKYSASSQLTVLEGENVVNLTLDRAMVPAARPQISTQPKDINQFFDESSQDDKKVELSIVASNTGDQEKLTYQWYSNTIKSTVGAEAVENGNVDTVEITISPNDTKYFYCVVTSTIEDNQYVIPTSVTSDIVKVAYLQQPQRTLEKIIADFNKTYMLLDSFDYTDFSVTEYYDDNTTTMVKSLDGSYIVTIPERSIGKVPVTITNSSKPEITTTIEIPVKYQLDESNLSISGDSSVEQNKDLKLTAEYKVDGKDSYNLYTSASSSSSYKIIENVNISWTGATAQSNPWEANANTASTGSQTATVKLTPTDTVWCVTTSEIEKSHSYEVTAATTAGGITDENSLLEAINQAQDGDSITIPNEITITNTITVNKNIIIDGNKTGTLFRSNKGTITGPMFEVSNSGNLTLQNITLDGQYNNDFYGGGNNPFIINNGGTLTVSSSTLTNNRMSPTGAAYGSIPQLYASAAIYSAGTTVITKSEISDVSSNNNTKGIVYGVTGSLTIIDTNITLPTSYNGNALYLESAVSYNINNKDSGLSQSYKSITPDSP
ncbi:MAG: hypothetical protein SOZ84_03045 [Treponema sp.]|nr:hypothetical protein [Treponema sp.]